MGNCPGHPTSVLQLGVGSVDDGIDAFCRDVTLDDFEA
jgi:hypothetical protein